MDIYTTLLWYWKYKSTYPNLPKSVLGVVDVQSHVSFVSTMGVHAKQWELTIRNTTCTCHISVWLALTNLDVQ